MTRDAEHTPTGYEDAASVVVNQAPAPSSLAGGEVRDMSGETVMGMRVAAYRHPASCPPDLDKAEWLAFFNGSPPNTYCEHWSTPGEHRTDVERLFTEADVRRILNAVTPRHEAPADHHERNLTASNAELIEQALSRPPLEAPAEGAGGLGSPSQWCDILPEPSGPAEGAGEIALAARALLDACSNGHQPGCDCDVAEEDVARSKPAPAAPSADRLREVVEGFVSDLTGSLKNRSTMLTINHNALTARIDQALAALKADRMPSS